MWDNPRQLHLAANALVGVALLIFAFAALQMVLRSPAFPLREVSLRAEPASASKLEIEAALEGVGGNFFAADLAAIRARLEQVPWVRKVEVRRVWPDRVEVALEEHRVLARWNAIALVNRHGEVFSAPIDEAAARPLPLFAGPPGSEGEVSRRYQRFSQLIGELDESPRPSLVAVILSARHAWQLRLSSGLQIELGRDAAEPVDARLARFVAAYPETLAKLGRRVGTDLPRVDLRYPNGFALRVPGLKG
jgi:cell division protein FtsQ